MIKTRAALQPVDSLLDIGKDKAKIVQRLLLWFCDAASGAIDGDDDSIRIFEEQVMKILDTFHFINYSHSITVHYGNEVTVCVNVALQLTDTDWAVLPPTLFNIR